MIVVCKIRMALRLTIDKKYEVSDIRIIDKGKSYEHKELIN